MDHNEDDAAKSAAAPSSANGKIPLIKIKLPKKAEEEAAAAVVEEVKSHYCKECNKNFSSGKALGGHMSSAHVQANKDYSFKKLSSKRKLSGSYSGSDNNTCSMCGRAFQSKKSLFGHMRCHPEREWRGMEPPSESKIDSSAEASSEEGGEDDQIHDSGHDVGFNLKGWPTSNKRGRGPVINNPVIRAPDSGSENKGSESFVAGLQLIKLLKGDSRKQENGPKLDLEKEQETIDEIESNGEGKGKLPENQDSESSNGGIDPNDELYITAIQVLVSGKRDNNNEKRVAVEEKAEESSAEIVCPSPSPSPSPDKYKCNECGKFFQTHQALGGHRSSHNKFKMSIVNTNERESSEMQVKKKRKMKEKKKKIVKGNVVGDGGGDGAFAFAFDLNMAPAEEEEDSSNHTASSNS